MPWLRSLAIVLAIVCPLIVAPGAWPTQTLTEFNCGEAMGVNGSQIVGWLLSSKTPDGWYGLSVANPVGCGTNFTVPGATVTHINGVSSANTMVGEYVDNTKTTRGFVSQQGGSPVTFSVNNSASTRPAGVNYAGNNLAWVVGQYQAGEGQHGFAVEYNISSNTLVSGTLVTFDVTGVPYYTVPMGISDEGKIVGRYVDSAGTHGFILYPQSPPLPPYASGPVPVKSVICAGGSYTFISGISNASGANPSTIAGSATLGNKQYAFYAPEPAQSTSSWTCTPVPLATTKGFSFVGGIDSKGQYMVGHGGKLGNFLYQLF